MDVPILDISYQWDHKSVVSGDHLLWLSSVFLRFTHIATRSVQFPWWLFPPRVIPQNILEPYSCPPRGSTFPLRNCLWKMIAQVRPSGVKNCRFIWRWAHSPTISSTNVALYPDIVNGKRGLPGRADLRVHVALLLLFLVPSQHETTAGALTQRLRS